MKLTLFFIFLSACLLHADDLTTRDGKVYQGYKVLSHDAGFITILYADGGGKIALSNLSDALQKQYGYNPARAAAAVAAANEQWKESHAQLSAERAAAAAQQRQVAAATAQGAVASSSPAASAKPMQTAMISQPSASPVNTVGAQAELDEDQQKLDGLNEDLAIARRQQSREVSMPDGDNHYNSGTGYHPNHTGVSTQQRIKDLQVAIAALKNEMVELKGVSSPVAKVAPSSGAKIPASYDDLVALYGYSDQGSSGLRSIVGPTQVSHTKGDHFTYNGIGITVVGTDRVYSVSFNRQDAFNSFEIADLLKGLSPNEDWVQKDDKIWTLPKAGAKAVWDGVGKLDVTST